MNKNTGPILAVLARHGKPLKNTFIVDAHGHLGPYNSFPFPDSNADALVSIMDSVGVDVLCVSAISAACGADMRVGNDLVINAVHKFPGRLLGYCTLIPFDADEAQDELERCFKQGLKAIKIHTSSHKKAYTAPAYRKALELANRLKLPVLAHTWGKYELGAIRELAASLPNITWLLGHSSVEHDEYIRIAHEVPSTMLEICASSAPYGLIERYVREVGADRILFGSDCAFISLPHQVGRVAMARISEEDKRGIFGLNAAKVFNLKMSRCAE